MSEPSEIEKVADASATMPLPAFRRRLLQVSSPAGPVSLGGGSPLGRATRRLMVTPWFAVATGFVVAAGVWIYSPHAELAFPNGRGGEVQCTTSGCTNSHAKNQGIPASAGTQPLGSRGGSPMSPPAHRPRRVTYRLLWQSHGRVFLLVSVTGRRVPRTWRLSFDLPGVQITGVEGAAWQPSGSDSGTAIWSALHTGSQTTGPGDVGQNGTGGWYQPGRSFVVVGTGVLVQPKYCTFNKAACKFVPAAAPAGQSASAR